MKAIITWLIKLKNWFSRIATWIVWEAKDVWKTILVLVVGMVISFLVFGRGKQWIRFAGFFLELLGILVVAKGLNDSRQLFWRPSLRQLALNWLSRYPKFEGAGYVLVAGYGRVEIRGDDDTLLARGHVGDVVPITLEERIVLLEKRLNLVDTQINEGRYKLEEEAKNRKAALDSEAEARVKGDEVVRRQLEEAVVGGILLETMGVVWLAFGLTLSSLSGEIACLISKLEVAWG